MVERAWTDRNCFAFVSINLLTYLLTYLRKIENKPAIVEIASACLARMMVNHIIDMAPHVSMKFGTCWNINTPMCGQYDRRCCESINDDDDDDKLKRQ